MSSAVALATTLYSASVLLRDTVACFQELQRNQVRANRPQHSPPWIACHPDCLPSPHQNTPKGPKRVRPKVQPMGHCKSYIAQNALNSRPMRVAGHTDKLCWQQRKYLVLWSSDTEVSHVLRSILRRKKITINRSDLISGIHMSGSHLALKHPGPLQQIQWVLLLVEYLV
jgi:hypothetical protein